MKAYHNTAVLKFDDDTTGNAASGATVTVRINSSQALASLFDVDDIAIGNPLTTDSNGNYSFKATDNIYDIIVSEGTANEVKLEKVEVAEIPIPSVLINDLSQAYDFSTIAEMTSSLIVFPVGKDLNVNGEGGTATPYKVQVAVSDESIAGGLYAKRLSNWDLSIDGVETVSQARLLTGLLDTNTVSINNPLNENQKGQYYVDTADTETSDDNGKTCIVTDEGVRLKVGIRPVTADVAIGDLTNHFDDNEILDSIYGAFVKSGVAMSVPGVAPQTLSGAGTADADLGVTLTYAKDWIYYANVTANAAGVSSIRLGGSGDAQADVIEISFNYNHVTSSAVVGTISINFFDVVTRVLYTGTQFADFAIVYDSKYDVFYMLDRGTFSLYSEIATRAEFANVSKNLSELSYINDASGSLIIGHSKLCKPNYIAIGDSLCGGDNFFSPNPSQGWTDYDHQWENHANAEGINTVIINRGVGGQRSDAITARVQADVIDQGCRQAYYHFSTNDARNIMGGPLSYATRSFNIQTALDLLDLNGIQSVIINSVYSNQNATWAAYYQDYLTADDGFRTLGNYKTWVDQMLVLADGSGTLDPALTDPDGTHLNQAGYTLMGQTIGAAAFSPVETVNKINDETKFDFPGGLQSFGKDVNNKPSGWAILEPVTGTLDYKVTLFTEGADKVVLGGYRESPSAWTIHVILSESVEPAVLSTYGAFATNDAGIAMFGGTVFTGNGAKDARYFANLLFNTGVSGVTIPDESEMQNLAWMVRF
jgi:lysophospholipase L1-like esterase